jgi:hypothetical protein
MTPQMSVLGLDIAAWVLSVHEMSSDSKYHKQAVSG